MCWLFLHNYSQPSCTTKSSVFYAWTHLFGWKGMKQSPKAPTSPLNWLELSTVLKRLVLDNMKQRPYINQLGSAHYVWQLQARSTPDVISQTPDFHQNSARAASAELHSWPEVSFQTRDNVVQIQEGRGGCVPFTVCNECCVYLWRHMTTLYLE